jgi:hypothetical protein
MAKILSLMSPKRTFLTLAFGKGKLPMFIALRSLATTLRTLELNQ